MITIELELSERQVAVLAEAESPYFNPAAVPEGFFDDWQDAWETLHSRLVQWLDVWQGSRAVGFSGKTDAPVR